jgi:hypothetical protein
MRGEHVVRRERVSTIYGPTPQVRGLFSYPPQTRGQLCCYLLAGTPPHRQGGRKHLCAPGAIKRYTPASAGQVNRVQPTTPGLSTEHPRIGGELPGYPGSGSTVAPAADSTGSVHSIG